MSEQEGPKETIVDLVVPAGKHTSTRLDSYLAGFLENLSRTKAQRGIKDGRVTVNGSVMDKVAYVVQPGDVLQCRLPKPPPMIAQPEDIPLDIVFEDQDLIVVNKPPGLVVHPAFGNRTGTLVNALLFHVGAGQFEIDGDDEDNDEDLEGLSTANAGPRFVGDPTIRPGLVHRLDKDTSGLMVIAKNDTVHAHLASQFADRTIFRRYQAIIWGQPATNTGTIEARIGRDKRDRRKMAVVEAPTGKHAVTHYTVVESIHNHSIAEFRLETGRTHQIRVHALYAGFPVFCDSTYGGIEVRRGAATPTRRRAYEKIYDELGRQALHAKSLGFFHPTTGESVRFDSEMPEDMQTAWIALKNLEEGV